MRTLTPHRLRDLFLISGGVALFVYILLRVINVSMSVDEQGSYFMFVNPGHFFPEEYDLWSANNHALNTFLMWVCKNVFGPGQLSLRLPNLLAGGLYLFSTAMIARRMKSPLIGVVAFVLMNTNALLTEYFGYARGYGLATGFMALAFWQLWVYCEEGYRWRNLVIVTVASVLSVFANYSHLNLFLPLMGCLFIIAIWRPSAQDVSVKTKVLHALVPVAALLTTLAIVIPVSLKISAAKGFWPNAYDSFWKNCVSDAIESSMLNSPGAKELAADLVIVAQIITVLTFGGIIWWTIQKWRKREFHLFPLAMVCILTIAVVGVVVQYHVLDTPLPLQRICLFFMWPWLMIVGLAASLETKIKRWTTIPFVILTGINLGQYVRTMSLEDMVFRPTSMQLDDAISYLKEKSPGEDRILLGYDLEFWTSGMEYYRQTLPMREFDLTSDTLTTHPLNEYLLVSKFYSGRPIGENWVEEKRFPNDAVLYHNSMRLSAPLSGVDLVLRRDTIKNTADGRVVCNFGACIPDSVNAPIGNILHFRYDLETEEESTGFIDVMIFRGDTKIYSSIVDIYPDSENQIAGHNEIIVPRLQKGDCIIASLNAFPVLPQMIKQFTVTIDSY